MAISALRRARPRAPDPAAERQAGARQKWESPPALPACFASGICAVRAPRLHYCVVRGSRPVSLFACVDWVVSTAIQLLLIRRYFRELSGRVSAQPAIQENS
jgi:hypothetical protein